MAKDLVVGICQTSAVEDRDGNWDAFEAQVREAARRGATLVCSQELFTAPYFCQGQDAARFDLAEPIPGPSTARAQALAKELGVVLVVSLFEERAPGLCHNTAVVVESDGEILGAYRKMHIPQDPGFDEKFYFAPGDQGFKVFETSVGKIGVLICWDQWFPEAARLTALQGAEILLYPTAIAWDDLEDAAVKPARPMPGAPPCVPTPSPMASSWRPPTASAVKGVWCSGAIASWPVRMDKFCPKPAPRLPASWWSRASVPAFARRAASGPSCATAASTPTAGSWSDSGRLPARAGTGLPAGPPPTKIGSGRARSLRRGGGCPGLSPASLARKCI